VEADVAGIAHHLEAFIAQYGLLALLVSVTLESLGAPLPGESAVLLASGAAAAGKLNVYAVAMVAFAAAVLGDNIGYLIGRKLGRAAIAQHGARFGLTEANLQRVETVAHKYGPMMVVVARFVVLLRQLNGLVAGTTGMRWASFIAANVVGAALWVGFWTKLAYRFGHSTEIIPYLWHHLGLVAAIAVPLLIAALVWLRVKRR
jgi:membrane protein DedA with SNARE-associated domain